MPSFVCKSCGMITENPEIVPHPDSRFYRGRKQKGDGFLLRSFNHSITCPVCENETRFWRDKPFPTDNPK